MEEGRRGALRARAKRSAVDFLANTLSQVGLHRDAARAALPAPGELVHRGYGAIDALYAAGLLSDEERAEWNTRFGDASSGALPAATRTVPMPAMAARSPDIERRAVEPSACAHGSAPAGRSLSGLRPSEVLLIRPDVNEQQPQLVLVELHEDGVIIDWIQLWCGPETAKANPRVAVRDNAGTEYVMISGSGGSLGENVRSRRAFVPEVPGHATVLEVQLETISWRIALDAVTR